MSSKPRTVFIVSDGTGITAETFSQSILAQFELPFRQVRLPFVDTVDKAFQGVREINDYAKNSGLQPIVFRSEEHTSELQSRFLHDALPIYVLTS